MPEFPGVVSPSWGLNGFHEEKILYSPVENSIREKQSIALDVAVSVANYVNLIDLFSSKYIYTNC